MADFLPDSRSRRRTGAVRSSTGTQVPVYCANCGREWGFVPEDAITFAFALCNECAEKHGDIAHTYSEPDSVFWERVANAQLEEAGRAFTPFELVLAVEDKSSPLAKLADEWAAYVRRSS
jgi:hypothetical protein